MADKDPPTPLNQETESQKTHTISDLQNPEFRDLWYRLHVFIYDLRNFTNPTTRSRLDSIADPAYMGQPYFNEEEVSILRSIAVGPNETLDQKIQSTLEERLNRRMKKRVESGDFRVCAAHDLAPVFEKAFNINPKKLAKDSRFITLMATNGLTLRDGEEWSGLGDNNSAPSGNNKKKKKKKKKG
ncbi:hypothetical protein FQN55_006047 [Onygenales sp. PD_40]|nr:hypothetical protein FQN55_006047 [Onygenales sp. PD_40]